MKLHKICRIVKIRPVPARGAYNVAQVSQSAEKGDLLYVGDRSSTHLLFFSLYVVEIHGTDGLGA